MVATSQTASSAPASSAPTVSTGPELRRLRLLRCAQCGRVRWCPLRDVVRYARRGWPVCCGEVMSLSVEARPTADPIPAPMNEA